MWCTIAYSIYIKRYIPESLGVDLDHLPSNTTYHRKVSKTNTFPHIFTINNKIWYFGLLYPNRRILLFFAYYTFVRFFPFLIFWLVLANPLSRSASFSLAAIPRISFCLKLFRKKGPHEKKKEENFRIGSLIDLLAIVIIICILSTLWSPACPTANAGFFIQRCIYGRLMYGTIRRNNSESP